MLLNPSYPVKKWFLRFFLPCYPFWLVFLTLLSTPMLQAQDKAVLVTDLTLPVPQASQHQPSQAPVVFATHYYGFQKGDVLVLNLESQKGKAAYSLEVVDYASGSPVLSVSQVKKRRNLQLPITHKAVYQFTLRAHAADTGPNTCRFTLHRIPAHDSVRQFNPHVTWTTRHDTTWAAVTEKVLVRTDIVPQTLLDKQFRVEAQANFMASNRSSVKFQLPANTSYWVYWVGVGQEPVVQLNEITKQFSKMAASVLAGSNPVIAFGMGLLPYLPQVTSGGNIDYYFLNQQNAQAFIKGKDPIAYPFASGQKIVSDFRKVLWANTPKTEDGSLYMGFQNNNTLTGLEVTLKVVAFTKEQKFETRTVRKPVKVSPRRMPVFGE